MAEIIKFPPRQPQGDAYAPVPGVACPVIYLADYTASPTTIADRVENQLAEQTLRLKDLNRQSAQARRVANAKSNDGRRPADAVEQNMRAAELQDEENLLSKRTGLIRQEALDEIDDAAQRTGDQVGHLVASVRVTSPGQGNAQALGARVTRLVDAAQKSPTLVAVFGSNHGGVVVGRTAWSPIITKRNKATDFNTGTRLSMKLPLSHASSFGDSEHDSVTQEWRYIGDEVTSVNVHQALADLRITDNAAEVLEIARWQEETGSIQSGNGELEARLYDQVGIPAYIVHGQVAVLGVIRYMYANAKSRDIGSRPGRLSKDDVLAAGITAGLKLREIADIDVSRFKRRLTAGFIGSLTGSVLELLKGYYDETYLDMERPSAPEWSIRSSHQMANFLKINEHQLAGAVRLGIVSCINMISVDGTSPFRNITPGYDLAIPLERALDLTIGMVKHRYGIELDPSEIVKPTNGYNFEARHSRLQDRVAVESVPNLANYRASRQA